MSFFFVYYLPSLSSSYPKRYSTKLEWIKIDEKIIFQFDLLEPHTNINEKIVVI